VHGWTVVRSIWRQLACARILDVAPLFNISVSVGACNIQANCVCRRNLIPLLDKPRADFSNLQAQNLAIEHFPPPVMRKITDTSLADDEMTSARQTYEEYRPSCIYLASHMAAQ